MTAPSEMPQPHDSGEAAFEEAPKRSLQGIAAKVVTAVALAFSAYQLDIAGFAPLSSLSTRSIHVGFLLALAFLIYPAGKKSDKHRIAPYDAVLAAVGFGLSLYHSSSRSSSSSAPATRARWTWWSGRSS